MTLLRVLLALCVASLLQACGGGAPMGEARAATPARVLALGDSLTQRTGLCTEPTLAECIQADTLQAAASWPTYLGAASAGRLLLQANEGRGGETCLSLGAWTAGPHTGQARGLLARLPVIGKAPATHAVVLIGINDVQQHRADPSAVAQCAAQVVEQLKASGLRVTLLTYPALAAWPDSVQRLNAALLGVGAVPIDPWPAWAAPHFASDGAHPNPAGAVLMALGIAQAIP